MKKFLMATDLSARSERALERAVSLARNHCAKLTVVHVVDEALPASLAETLEKVEIFCIVGEMQMHIIVDP